jgi:amidohydrolase
MKSTTDRIKELIEATGERCMDHYRHIHRHPELSYQEEKTAAYVAQVLEELPMDEIKKGVGGYGITALLKGNRPGPVVALRADMDALNIQEKTEVPFASENQGVMHACGHDSHTAMLLTAAEVLCSLKENLAGAVKFVFQPAEEMTPRGGAQGMIEDGALENPKVNSIIGIHVWPTLATGTMGIQSGAVSASSDHLKLTVTGKSYHGSMPNQGVDAIVAGSSVVMALQTIVSRNVSPHEAAVITLGTVNGGDRYNIVPSRVDYDGTVRCFNQEIHEKLPCWIERTATHAAQAMGAEVEIDYQKGYPSTMNHPEIVEICRNAAGKILPEDGVLPPLPVPPGGEDFAFYTLRVPATFAWLGCRPEGVSPEDMPALHNDKFLPDPKSFPLGVSYLVQSAVDLLEAPLEDIK